MKALALLPLLLILCTTSCTPGHLVQGTRASVESSGHNSPSDLPPYHSKVLKLSPAQTKSGALPGDNLTQFLSSESFLITESPLLQYDCEGDVPNCLRVKEDAVTRPLVSHHKRWAFHPESKEFLQVNTYYHGRKGVEEFFRLQRSSIAASTANFDAHSSLPASMRSSGAASSLWYWSSDGYGTLNLYTHCQQAGRPFFLFATRELCLGDHQSENLNYAEDPDIIHHEMGHFFSTVLFNQRNMASATLGADRRVSFGGRGYSEVDLISEGISDWFAHHHSGQDQLFQWAGGFTGNARPVSERDSLHRHNNLGIAPNSENRLRYPDHVNYYHYAPLSFLAEDAQQAGMIVSHFLVALGKEIEETCGVQAPRSRELVFYLLQETLNELGDLTSRGKNSSMTETINMSSQFSDTWVQCLHSPQRASLCPKIGQALPTG